MGGGRITLIDPSARRLVAPRVNWWGVGLRLMLLLSSSAVLCGLLSVWRLG
jgi:hypothetical protein